ncbi:hypothetical protein DV735_g2536, partial [Chaetothyriales sp. CBS 134920]
MNRFTADYSSSVGSSAAGTPAYKKDLFSIDQGPSTTPLVPPPATVFGSSQLGGSKVRKPLFQRNSQPPPPVSSPPDQRPFHFNTAPPPQPTARAFHTSFKSSLRSSRGEEPGPEYDDSIIEQDFSPPRRSQPSLMKFSTMSTKQSQQPPHCQTRHSFSQLPRKGNPDLLAGLAHDLSARSQPAQLVEDDTLILETEDVMQELQEATRSSQEGGDAALKINVVAQDLGLLWQRHSSRNLSEAGPDGARSPASLRGFEKAYYLASLLLALYHPTTDDLGAAAPIPKILFQWLDKHHTVPTRMYQLVNSTTPNVTSHEYFWDALLSCVLRGKLPDAMHLLEEADFKYAVSAQEDEQDEPGYRGSQLQTVQHAVFRARQLLNTCPFLDDNWDTSSEDWQVYRAHLENDLQHLAQLANQPGSDADELQSDHFGLRRNQQHLFSQSQKRQNLPLTIYHALSTLYSILLGSTTEIISQSQDWLEASVALTVWWDGIGPSDIANWSLRVSQAGNQAESPWLDPYLIRLRDSFLCVTDPEGRSTLQLNGLSPVDVGLGCILQGSIGSALSIIQRLSQCVASAIAEVGSAAGWLTGISLDPNLNETDLMVLTFGTGKSTITKDDVLEDYASAVFARERLQGADGQVVRGWELALAILRRLDDEAAIHDLVSDLLLQIDVSNSAGAERAIALCTDLGLISEARTMSERYGDYLVNSGTDYGVALLCYARSHHPHKVQVLTDILISYCLVQSEAFPPDNQLDLGLKNLVATPKSAFADIAQFDPNAAATLQFYTVGYACIRRFYDLRDGTESRSSTEGKKPLGPLARRRAAAKTLIAAISSSADSIYGGLYDATRETAIQVDCLLTLLGEATALVGGEKRIFTSEQLIALLAAIEDLETVNSRVFDANEECLQAALRSYHGSSPPSPRAVLKKSMSSGTNSNFSFSMIGSEILAKSGESLGGRSEGSTFLVASRRLDAGTKPGWDWRDKFATNANDVISGRAVLRYLREQIARELSLAELDGM